MSNRWLSSPLFFRAVLLSGMLVATVSLSAADGGFTATLSADKKNSAGLTTLTIPERATLDQIIATEVARARKEDALEFDGTFVARRTDEELRQAGLDRLTPEQLANLNALVATAVASGPKPKERPRIRDSEIFNAPKKPEVHGEVSLTYGRSSGGGDFRAASMWVDYFDPNTGLGLSVGVSRSSGKGLYGSYPDYYDGLGSFYGPGSIGDYGWPFRSGFGFEPDEMYYGQGQSYRALGDWNSAYYRGFRRR